MLLNVNAFEFIFLFECLSREKKKKKNYPHEIYK